MCGNGEFTVRKLLVDELPRLTELFEYNDVSEMLAENTANISNGDIDIFAMFCGEELIGELHVKYRSDDAEEAVEHTRAYLYAFRISAKYQGRGYGSLLLKEVLNALSAIGYIEFTIGVEDDNSRARHIYEKLGFTTLLSRKYEEYQGDCYCYDLYLKTLSHEQNEPVLHNLVLYSAQNQIPDRRFDEMYRLIYDSFPPAERRSREGHYSEFGSSAFRSLCYQPDRVSAVLNYWEFDVFVFLEHFAVSSALRGKGIGSLLLRELLKIAGEKPVMLEAEPPVAGELSERRVKFYKRLGFVLNDYEYWQPALQEGELPVRLMIMSSPAALSFDDFVTKRSTLYKYVYQVSDDYKP